MYVNIRATYCGGSVTLTPYDIAQNLRLKLQNRKTFLQPLQDCLVCNTAHDTAEENIA